LNAQANRLARQLQALGAGPGVTVGLHLQRSLELPLAHLAVLKSGAAFVPLDPELPAARLAQLLADTAAPIVLTQSAQQLALQAAVDGAQPQWLALDAPPPSLAAHDSTNLALDLAPDALAYVLYTSGSTGMPKGVMVPHVALSSMLQWTAQALDLRAGDRWLQSIAISFDPSVVDLLMPLMRGAATVAPAPGRLRSDAAALALELAAQRITHVMMVPSLLRPLLDQPALAQATALRHVVSGGEALPSDLIEAFRARLPQARLANFYGPTEATVTAVACVNVLDTPPGVPVPIGRPIGGTHCHVLGPERQLLPAGAEGELFIGGRGLALGYLNRPDLTAERFVPDPFNPGQRLYATGDRVRWLPDGQLQYLGRVDEQVKIRGVRIELGEVEAAINALPQIHQAVVAAHRAANGLAQLVVYVKRLPGEPALQVAPIRAALMAVLPDALVPGVYVELEDLPLLPSGKVNRKALPAPDAHALRQARPEHVPPQGDTENTLAALWQELLGLPRVGRGDHFFDLGGHSLLATRLVTRVHQQLGVDLALREVFDHPQLSAMAARIDAQRDPEAALPPTAIPAVPRNGPLPVSYSQRRMWLVQQMTPETTAYNMPFAVRLQGELDPALMERTLDAVSRRHEAFRTRFELIDGEPMQIVGDHVPVSLQQIDFSHLPLDEAEAAARAALTALAQRPFDLSTAALHHVHLLRLGARDHVLIWVMHHVIGDAWSAGVLMRDLNEVFTALQAEREAAPRPTRIDYADYAVWQRQTLQAQALDGQMAYWRQRLSGLEPLSLPTDRQRRGAANGRGGGVVRDMRPGLLGTLQRFSAAHGVTPYMTLMACFAMLLGRVSGHEDVAVGTPIANRRRFEAEHLVGTFVNTLVMRTDLSGNPSFEALLARVRDAALDAYAHQDASFERLVEELSPGRDATASPLVQVMFNVINTPMDMPTFGNLKPKIFEFDRGAAQFDLSVTVDTQLYGKVHLEFAEDLFDRASAERLSDAYMALLDQVLQAPQQPIGSYSVLSARDADQLARWNDTAADYPRELNLDQWLQRQAEATPDAIALVQPGAGELTQQELHGRANALARLLRERGIGRGDLVGLCTERGLEMVVSQLAVLKSGAAYVPLDPTYPADRLAYMAEDAKLALLVTESALVDVLDWPRDQTLLLDIDLLTAFTDESPLAPDPERDARPQDPAYVIYTSGSTGKPKGVVVHQQAVVNFLASMAKQPGLTADDCLLAVTTLSFDIAVLELLLPLSVGARAVLASRDDAVDGLALKQLCEEYGITVMQATPSTWRMLIEAGWQGHAGFKALIGGEGLPGDLAALLLARCGELWNMYGPTETTVWSTCWRVTGTEGISIGTPIANTTVQILDARLQPCPIGVPGEICIGGEGVTLGYLQRAELTAERFVPDPLRPGQRLYRTGDRGRWRADGLLEHQGRMDFQVKVRGYRIELGEIETALTAHPAITRAVVIVREDRPGDQRLVAYLVSEGEMPAVQALRDHLRGSLPDYMVPQHFVGLDAIPLLPNGKINRHALPAPAAEAHSGGERDEAGFIAPSTPTELELAAIWARLLGVERVGSADNFFNLGGHSLLAMRAVAEINSRLNTRITVRQMIFDNLGQIARAIGMEDRNR
ncbi:amino acid adenylation domain-containing protein, partial [Hydrogenophaga sp. T2]|uniref:amino acid adenylation domain-containing protein n=1 Tax=Hydrogenophaga sp. T2 TaxID=3132823 RepID=UPI003CF1DB11